MSDESVLTWRIALKPNDDVVSYITECPNCGALGSICAIEESVRWSPLHLTGTTTGNVATHSADYEHYGWVCRECHFNRFLEPDGFSIEEWY